MIFIGDLVCPSECVDLLKRNIASEDIFDNEVVVINLEANILCDNDVRKPLTLWNSPRIVELFHRAKHVIVSLANNHAYDYPEKILTTTDYLKKHGIGVFGLYNEDGSFDPYEYTDEGGIVHAFFGHCWRLYTRTNPNKDNDVRIVDCSYTAFSERIRQYKRNHTNTKVYCMMHWNYDLEHLPFPMHRKVARQLIDSGADVVVGSHSHRPQGGELYNGRPILYGMGNFYLPSGVFFSGNLEYPECSHLTCSLQIQNNQNRVVWFYTDGESPLRLVEIEPLNGKRIAAYSPYVGMSDEDYVKYFKINRLKKTFVPVFDEIDGMKLLCKESWAIMRVAFLRAVLKVFNK